VTEVYGKFADYLKVYTQYVNNYDNALQTLSVLKKNRAFMEILAEARQDDEAGGLDIVSYMIMPVQRIPRSFVFFFSRLCFSTFN